MRVTHRSISEIAQAAGYDPEVTFDTLEHSPPVYDDVVAERRMTLYILPAATDQAVALPDCCWFKLLSDEPITWKWAAGETEFPVRELEVGGEDSSAVAIPATTALISGNGVSAATVRILYAETVA